MIYINITKFVLINSIEKDHSMIETRRLKNIVIFIQTTLTVPCEKSKTVSFASSIMKNVNLLLLRLRFPGKLICCIAFQSASSTCCLCKSIAIILFYFDVFCNNCNLAINHLCNHLLGQLQFFELQMFLCDF